MNTFGLIGNPLDHSFSKQYFTEKFEKENIMARYENYPLGSIDQIKELVEDQADLLGLNITIPYKTQVLDYLDEIDDAAADIGAVNTIKILRTGKQLFLKGYNTDIYGFKTSLIPLLNPSVKSALILGTGGACLAVKAGLTELGIAYTTVSRYSERGDMQYEDLSGEFIENQSLIINTSPLGMYPNTEEYPDIPYEYLSGKTILYDLVYNPSETKFMMLGRGKDCIVKNGLSMLQLQADKAWEIWTGQD